MPRLCLLLILIFLCWGFSGNNPNDSFNDMPPGLKEAWTHGYQLKQYYTDKKTGDVTVFSRPIKYGKSDKTNKNVSSNKKREVSELPPSFGNSPTYLKKTGYGSKCKSSSRTQAPVFELPPEAYGEECGDMFSIREARKLKRINSSYSIKKITQKKFKQVKKEEREAAIPDHKLTWYELMKRKGKKAEKLKRLKASLTVIAKNKNVKPAKNKSYGARSPTSSRLNKYTIKTRKLKKGRKLKSKFKKNVSKLKTKVFGFSRKRASKNKKSYFGRVPTGNYSSSQSPSSNRMIYYAPNKSSRYEWGSNSKAIKR